MNLYELTYVLRSDLEEDALTAVQERITGRLSDAGGEVIKSEAWGRRRLAYPIERIREGLYFTSILRMPGTDVRTYETQLKLIPEILRFLLIRQEEKNINMTGSLLPTSHRPAATPAAVAKPEAEGTEETAATPTVEAPEAGDAVTEPPAGEEAPAAPTESAAVVEETGAAPATETEAVAEPEQVAERETPEAETTEAETPEESDAVEAVPDEQDVEVAADAEPARADEETGATENETATVETEGPA